MWITKSVAAILAYLLNLTNSQLIDNKVLSRTRRLAVPSFSNWQFKTTLEFLVTIPMEGLDTSTTIKVPFSHTLDLTR